MTSRTLGKVLCISLAMAIPSVGNMLIPEDPFKPKSPPLSPERREAIKDAQDVLKNTTAESREAYLGMLTDLIDFGPDAEQIKTTMFQRTIPGGFEFVREHYNHLKKDYPNVRMHPFNMARITLEEIAMKFPSSVSFLRQNYNATFDDRFVFGQKNHAYPNAATINYSYADFKAGHKYVTQLAQQKPLLFMREPQAGFHPAF